MAKSEPNQTNQVGKGVSLGPACFGSGSEFEDFEDAGALTARKIRHFSQSFLSPQAWYRKADELIEAMDVVGRNVERFWDDFNSITFACDMTTDPPTTYQKPKKAPQFDEERDVVTKHNLINQHMMLAGFAIENLCKGYLAARLSPDEQEKVKKAGELPRRLQTHNVLNLVLSTGMGNLSDRVKNLLARIAEAIWRGRYPIPTSQDKLGSFAQWEDDIDQIKMFLPELRAHVGAKDS
jgi:hypothetical protein